MNRIGIALQLYTVRDLLAADFVGTLKKVRAIGYTHVELAGHGPYAVGELKRILDDCGLTPVAEHSLIEPMENDLSRVIDETRELAVEYLVCSFLPEPRRRDEAGWRQCAQSLNAIGRKCREQGIQFCYHNHSFEFTRVGSRYALDVLYEQTEPANMQAELDVYWVQHGGADPLEYLHKLAGRCPLVHLKDMADDADRSFAPLGEGVLDFRAVCQAAVLAGARWGIVEQDTCKGHPLDAIALSLNHLKKLEYA